MHNKPGLRTEAFPHPVLAAKGMSSEEFAALGAETVVFMRPVSGAELVKFMPEAQFVPDDADFHLLVSGGGVPVLVSDNLTAIHDWLDDSNVTLVQRH
jgi:hypothetical protein